MQAIYKPDINLNNHQYSNHTPKFSLNKRVWPTKLLIIKCRCGCQIACGQRRENYYVTSDGLRKKNDKLLLFRNLILTCTITLHACFWYQYMGNSLEIMSMQVRIFTRILALRYIGFVMYYVYGVSGPSLLTESTDSMILHHWKFHPQKIFAFFTPELS